MTKVAWIPRSYILSATSLKGDQDKSSRGGWEYVQRLSKRFLWGDVFAEAQEISQRRNIDLDSIALCKYRFFLLWQVPTRLNSN